MTDVLVSVVMPAFNSEKYIAECIESVLNQTYQNLELIIVDDGSSDNTVDLIKGYNGNRIKLIQQKNAGSAKARNLGIEHASGLWIAFIDSDDIWLADKITKQLDHCFDKVWSHTDMYFHGDIYPAHTRATDFTPKYAGLVFKKLLVENSIGSSSVMIKKEIIEDFDGFNTKYRALQDWDLWIRIAAKHPICYINEPLVYYRTHSESISRNARKTLPYHIDLINRVFANESTTKDLQELKPKTLSRSCQICSHISEQEGDYLFSCYCIFRSILYQPVSFSNYTRLVKLLTKAVIYYFSSPEKLMGSNRHE